MTDEERVTLYLDGAMDAEQLAQFERELAARPELAELTERWRENDARLRSAFDLPMPDGLAERMGLGPTAPAQVVDLSEVRSRRDERRRIPARWGWAGGGAMAAALVAALALGLGGDATDPFASQQFQVAMQRLPSNVPAHLAGGATLTPILSFADGRGRFCREFALAGDEPRTGIACREQGRWQVEGVAAGAPPTGAPGEIRTAGGEGEALDPLYRRLQAGDPIDAERERALISRGWDSRGE